MKAKDAMKLLGCTNATLRNYVNKGILQVIDDPNRKYKDYDDDSVFQLLKRNKGNSKNNNTVILFKDNQKFEFVLNELIVNKIIDLISFELKRDELVHNLSR